MESPVGGWASFNSPLPSPASTDYEAVETVHGLDITSYQASAESRSRVVQPSNLAGFDDLCPFLPWEPAMSPASAEPVRLRPLGCDCEVGASESEDEVSLDETDSEDELRPKQLAAKRPVGAWGPAGSGDDEEERPSSGGDPIAEAPEWQQELEEEEDEEFEDDDDEYDPEAAPVRPVRRAAGGEQPARTSAAPAPTISSRKASAWSQAEDAACIKFMKEVCTLDGYAAIAGTEKRFEVVADRMKREAGFNRTASGVKLQWNRRLRAASKFEDRGEKKRASGLTTSALPGQGTKRGTSAVTSLAASTPSKDKESSATSASSKETSLGRRQNNKRKANHVDSDDDDDDDDDFVSAPRPSKPAKRVRSTSVGSSSAVPSTQDVAYYDLSTENILSGPRSSRNRRAPTITAPPSPSARSSRQKPITTISDDDDDEEEVIPSPKPSARSRQQKRARTIDDDEDDEQPAAAPSPKRKRISNDDEQSTAAPQPKKKRMSDFTPLNRFSNKDGRLLDKSKTSDLAEWYNPKMHYTRKASPELAPTSKAYWEKLLADRQARLAIQREEYQRRQAEEQAEEDDEEEDDEEDDDDDEDPVVNPADRTRRNRELRRQMSGFVRPESPSESSSTVRAPSTTRPSPSINASANTTPPSAVRPPSNATRPSLNTTRPSSTISRPDRSSSSSTINRFPPITRPSSVTGRPSSFTRPSSSTTSSSNINRSSSTTNRPSTTTRPPSFTGSWPTPPSTTSSSSRTNPRPTFDPLAPWGPNGPSFFGSTRPSRRFGPLSPIAERSETPFNSNRINNAATGAHAQGDAIAVTAAAAQIAADEEMARQMQEEWNEGPAPRVRRSRGFN
ncbi:hypothetical protein E4T48_02613 [Aureobasidium sp. EXF-10727]|nr:hypothetical protein E4T48_02613 [Aureobasidium sp. EXF-10727]